MRALRARGTASTVCPSRSASPDAASAHDFVVAPRAAPVRSRGLPIRQFVAPRLHVAVRAAAIRGSSCCTTPPPPRARGRVLLRERRATDYRAELAWSEPDVSPDVAELAVAGFDSALYFNWPMVRPLVETSRLVAVHGDGAARELLARLPARARCESIRLGEGVLVSSEQEAAARRRGRAPVRDPGRCGDVRVLRRLDAGQTPDPRSSTRWWPSRRTHPALD